MSDKETEFKQFVFDMHLQNTNGREGYDELIKFGIDACYEEMKDNELKAGIHFYKYALSGTSLEKTIELWKIKDK